jgi:hypothetical protein
MLILKLAIIFQFFVKIIFSIYVNDFLLVMGTTTFGLGKFDRCVCPLLIMPATPDKPIAAAQHINNLSCFSINFAKFIFVCINVKNIHQWIRFNF